MRAWAACGLILAGLLPVSGCGGSGGAADRTRSAGPLTGRFTPTPDPPRVGHDSGFALELTENGQPAAGASVRIETFFRGLNQTGPAGPCQETAPGRYEIRDLSTGMGGKWEAVYTITRTSQPDVQLTFPFVVSK